MPRRAKALTPVLILLGTVALAGSGFVPWWSRNYRDPLTGPKTVTVMGSDVIAGLVPMALVMAAGWAAAALSRGLVRRVIGLVVAATALAAAAWALTGAGHIPVDALAAGLTRPAEAVGPATRMLTGVGLAVIGGLAGAVGGVLLSVSRGRQRAAAGGYDVHHAPAARRAEARREAAQVTTADPDDPSQLWRALDVGLDPTAGSAPERDARLPPQQSPRQPSGLPAEVQGDPEQAPGGGCR